MKEKIMKRTGIFRTSATFAGAVTLFSLAATCAFAQSKAGSKESPVISVADSNGTSATSEAGLIKGVKPIKRDTATIYRQVLPDGRIVYGDEPMQGHKIDKVIEVDLRSTSTWAAKTDMNQPSPNTKAVSEENQKAAERLSNAEKSLQAATARLQAAEIRLAQANEAVKRIETPLAGERSMNVNGSSRLNSSYFARQAGQRAELQAAGIELDAALTMMRAAQGS